VKRFRWLPPGALHRDPTAYLKSERARAERVERAGIRPATDLQR
jgi:hypothetical protein